MNQEEKARRLTHHLQTVLEEAEAGDRKNAAVREKLSSQEVRVLRAISRQDCCIMGGIADAICLSLSTVTGLIDRLVSKKLVRRDRSTSDRRVVQVELTDAGRELNEAALEGRVDFAQGVLKALSASEQEALLGLFGKISERIKAEKKTG